ncbi:BamA/TamA family outer membrane protein [Pseudopedobacter beijingensis]|uniref:BamA/TamA family outer membrane protein n=1 Tax=Pseudopedobacter beijingensis TaxID=1207056 RepID=A0ABW4IG57_9SPHI
MKLNKYIYRIGSERKNSKAFYLLSKCRLEQGFSVACLVVFLKNLIRSCGAGTMGKIKISSFLWLIIMLSSCSNIKYLPEGEKLYIGGEVKVKGDSLRKKEKKALQENLQTLIRPKPNSSFFGLRPKLFFYNIAGETKKEKGIRYWIKNKLGEPPVYASKLDVQYNVDVLQNRVENLGYFRAHSEGDTTSKNKKVTAHYLVQPGVQYKIRKVVFPEDTTELAKAIRADQAQTLLKAGRPYDLDVIKSERERIDSKLKERGFYYFAPDYVIAKVDSTIGKQEVDILLEVKKQTPAKSKGEYFINDIYIYPDYSINGSSVIRNNNKYVTQYKGFKVIDRKNTIKPQVFDRTMFFEPGDKYNRTDHNLSLNRLVSLGTFKFVKNQFKETDSLSNKLDVYYFLTPNRKKSVRLELLGKTNSANYRGTELSLNWLNRNTLRGAEQLTISAFGGFEVQIGGQNKGYNIYRYGADATLVFPRFIAPFNVNTSGAFIPKTQINLGYEHQRRLKLYTLRTFKGSFGYVWKENVFKEHEFKVLDVTYVNSNNVTQEYLNKVDSMPSLGRIIEKQLIFGPTYFFTYTNTTLANKPNTFYYRGGIDLSATITGLFMSKKDTAKIFGVPYSQYAKMEHDFRYYIKVGAKNKWANRVFVGVGLPYGNSREIPYIKQFFSGGTNSIRAFRARSIGPGSYMDPNTAHSFVPDYSGDIKLELNTEYRAKLFSIVEGALFADAGNVWLMNRNSDRPGAEFTKDFMDQLAVGVGAGIRFDLSFLILRGDLAMPIRKPYLPKGERWTFDQIDLGNKQWRRDNLIFNLAIGYPF